MSQDVLSIIASFFGSFGFAIIYNIRGRRVLIPAIGGAVFWAVYLVFLHFVNTDPGRFPVLCDGRGSPARHAAVYRKGAGGDRTCDRACGGDHGRDVVEEADRGAGAHSS